MARLPSGYQELTHIESTGTQYINLGIPCDKITIRTSFIPKGDGAIFGASDWSLSDYVGRNYITISGSSLSLGLRNTYPWMEGAVQNSLNTLEAVFSRPSATVKLNGVTKSFSYGNYALTERANLYFLASAGTSWNIGSFFHGCVFETYILVNETTEFKLVPAKRLSDNAIGMFDLVSQSFFGNAGTGEFIAGDPVIYPIIPTWGSGLAQVTQKELLARRFAITPRKLWLYKDGIEYVPFTIKNLYGNSGNITCTKTASSLRIDRTNENEWLSKGFTTPLLQLNGKRELHALVKGTSLSANYFFGFMLSATELWGTQWTHGIKDMVFLDNQSGYIPNYKEILLDIPDGVAQAYIQFYCRNGAFSGLCYAEVKEIWLE